MQVPDSAYRCHLHVTGYISQNLAALKAPYPVQAILPEHPDCAETLRWLHANHFSVEQTQGADAFERSPNSHQLITRLYSNDAMGPQALTRQALAFSDLGQHVLNLTSLQVLTVANNSIDAAVARALGPHLRKLRSLRELILGGRTRSPWTNSFTMDGLDQNVAAALGPHLSNLEVLERLELHSYRISDDGAKCLGPHIAKLNSLKWLLLNGNSIGDEGAKALSPHLAKISTLAALDLSGNKIGNFGARALGNHLRDLVFLKKLSLCDNNIEAAGAAGMTTWLKKGKVSLKWLGLADNDIDDDSEEFRQLRDSLASLASLGRLRWLAMNGNPISVQAKVKLRRKLMFVDPLL